MSRNIASLLVINRLDQQIYRQGFPLHLYVIDLCPKTLRVKIILHAGIAGMELTV